MKSMVQLRNQRLLQRRRSKTGEFYKYWKYRSLVLMFLPGLIYYIIFKYIPMYGLQLAFKEYLFSKGIWRSPWVGLQHFRDMFAFGSFLEVFRNTIVISLLKIICGFPAPILFALFLNEIRHLFFKKAVQTISYLPHFVSWVILGGLFMQFLSPSMGPINILLRSIGIKPIYFLANPKWFRSVLVVTSIWKNIGWGSIIYLAALSSVNPELYEAAYIDGAGRLQRMRHISLPSLAPVITIMIILSLRSIVQDDFDQIFNLYNEAVYSVADVLSTYIYRTGLMNMKYSFATAVGLFKNVIAFFLIVIANTIARRISEYAIW